MEPLTRAKSGRPVSELTVDRATDQQLSLDDIRIHPETLLRQAAKAEAFGNAQLAANLRRGAELALLDDDELMQIYHALRPGRSSSSELRDIAASLARRGLARCADLINEAADVYERCGLTR